jgi:hypothetical protein
VRQRVTANGYAPLLGKPFASLLVASERLVPMRETNGLSGEFILGTDEHCTVMAVVVQPIGEDKSGGVVFWCSSDGCQERGLVAHALL